MKKNNLFTLGMTALLLSFGLMFAGCDTGTGGGGGGDTPTTPTTPTDPNTPTNPGGGGNRDSALIGKWYNSEGLEAYEFKADGTLIAGGTPMPYTWTTTSGKINSTLNGVTTLLFNYSISDSDLTLSDSFGLATNTYHKQQS
jgi:hypothetical protein